MRVAVFRWKAVVPLLVFGAVTLGLWLVFADRIARRTAESVGTTLIGAEVEIERLHLDLGMAGADCGNEIDELIGCNRRHHAKPEHHLP